MIHRWISLVLGTLLMVAGVRPAAAQTASIKLTVQPFFEGNYRAGNWLPFLITVANQGTDVRAVVSVQTGTSFATTVELPGGAEKSVVLYARPLDEIRRTATVRALVEGAEIAKVDVPIVGFNSVTQMVGYLSEQALTLPLPSAKAEHQKLEAVALRRDQLPERGEGLSMFDLLVIDGAPLTDLNANQQQALADWVRLGGQLVIGGTGLDTTLKQIPETLRPATINGSAPRGQISLLPELAAAQSPAATALSGQPNTRTIAIIDTTPVGIQQEVGQGRVTVLGFSLTAPELRQIEDATLLWENAANIRTGAVHAQRMEQIDDVQAQQFASVLTLLPVLAMPPLTTLAIVLGLYLLLIGPGLYFLLRRLDRQAWGWIAVPLVTIVFSLGAYGYGLQLRGNDTILNQITVVESGAGRARVRTYAGLFSPRTQTYQINADGDALFEPLNGSFGAGGAALAGGQYLQGSGSIRDLSVPQWSLRSFMAQQIMDLDPLQINLSMEGSTLRGTVRNTGTQLIRDATLVHDVQVAKIGDLPAGESRSVELTLDQQMIFDRNAGISSLILGNTLNQVNRRGQLPVNLQMQQTIVDTLFNPLYDAPTGPVVIGWMEQSPLKLNVDGSRIQHQQLSVVLAPANVSFRNAGSITLARGWFDPTFEVDGPGIGGPCVTRSGDGWYVDTGIMTATMQLPAALQSSQIDTAALVLERDGPPSGLKLSIFDWSAGQSVEQTVTDLEVPLDQPQRYFSPTGLLRARVDVTNENAKGGGCVSLGLRVERSRT